MKNNKREQQIQRGRFLVTPVKENPERKRLLSLVPANNALCKELRKQIDEAFRFNDPELIAELREFIKNNIQPELDLFPSVEASH